MTRKKLIKKGSGLFGFCTDRECTEVLPQNTIICDTPGGSYGCFIKDGTQLSNTYGKNLRTIIYDQDNLQSVLNNLDFLKGKGFKIFYSYHLYLTELYVLRELINKGFTYDELNLTSVSINDKEVYGIHILYPNGIPLKIPDTKLSYISKNEGINIIFSNICTTDLYKVTDKFINYNQFINNIIPFIIKLHSNDFIHKDIKPANILLCGDKYKLIDFGLTCHMTNIQCLGKELVTYRYSLPYPNIITEEQVNNIGKYINTIIESSRFKFKLVLQKIQTSLKKNMKQLPIINIYNKITWTRNDWYALAITILELLALNKFQSDTDTNQLFNDVTFLSSPLSVQGKDAITAYFNDRLPTQQGGKRKKPYSNKN